MKARLILENVGPFRGKKVFTFESGKLNIISGANREGKTTVAKALSAVISLPCTNPLTITDAEQLGIKRTDGIGEPLVNINEEKAKISLEYDKYNQEVIIFKKGTIEYNSRGKENFLFAGMIMRNSRIFRQLEDGKNNFNWITDEMSLAGEYDTALKVINEKIVEIEKIKTEVLNRKEKIKNLTNKKNDIEKKREMIDTEIRKWEKSLKNFHLLMTL